MYTYISYMEVKMEKRFKIEKIEKYNEEIKDKNLKLVILASIETVLAMITISIISDLGTSNYIGIEKIMPSIALATVGGTDAFGIYALAEVISNKTILKFKRDCLLEEMQELESQQGHESKSR